MWTDEKNGMNSPTDYKYRSANIDLSTGNISIEAKNCQDLEDFLGGIGRIFKVLSNYDVSDPYDPSAPLVMELGCFSGTNFMTGLRTFFGGYSPLKNTRAGAPSAMYSAGSGKFGSKTAFAGIDEIIFLGRSEKPVTLIIKSENLGGPPSMELVDASGLCGKDSHEKIMALSERYADAHFAVIGPPGENYKTNRMASIVLSSENQLKSGDCKPRFCGRGGFGGVMGSKNLIAIVAQAPDDKSPVTEVVKEANKVISRGAGSKKLPRRLQGRWRWRHMEKYCGSASRSAACLRRTFGHPEMMMRYSFTAALMKRHTSLKTSPASSAELPATRTYTNGPGEKPPRAGRQKRADSERNSITNRSI